MRSDGIGCDEYYIPKCSANKHEADWSTRCPWRNQPVPWDEEEYWAVNCKHCGHLASVRVRDGTIFWRKVGYIFPD